jgi:hypothetical protein
MKKIFVLPFFLLFIIAEMDAQNVGIGTSTPAAKLDIRHASSISSPHLLLYNTNPLDFSRLQLQNASGNKFWHIAGYLDEVTNANSRLNFFQSATGDVMSLTGDGKVGIGTVNPLEKLVVFTPENSYGFAHTNGTVKLSSYISANDAFIGTVSNHSLNFFINDGVIPMTMINNGNIGIGTTSPQFKLDVAGRMKIRTGVLGNIFTTPGIWFDDYRDGSNRIFFGMQDSIRVGFYGEGSPGAAWAFNFNARNGEVTANDFKYTSPKTQIYSLSGVDFRTTSITDNYQLATAQGYGWMNNGTNPVLAPVHLPHGAVITSMVVYFFDSHVTQNLVVRLRVGHGFSSISDQMAEVISSGTPGNTLLIDNSILFSQVNNAGNFYFITAESSTGTWTDAGLVINQVQINYTLSGPN